MTDTPSVSTTATPDDATTLDIEALFPADPDLMASPEGDQRGLAELQDAARQRRRKLERA